MAPTGSWSKVQPSDKLISPGVNSPSRILDLCMLPECWWLLDCKVCVRREETMVCSVISVCDQNYGRHTYVLTVPVGEVYVADHVGHGDEVAASWLVQV